MPQYRAAVDPGPTAAGPTPAELASLGTTFAQNVLRETLDSAVIVDTAEELDGFSDAQIRAAASAASAFATLCTPVRVQSTRPTVCASQRTSNALPSSAASATDQVASPAASRYSTGVQQP